MLTLAELRRKADRKYLSALCASLTDSATRSADAEPAVPLFPWRIPCGKLTEDEARGNWLERVDEMVRHARHPGYELRQELVNTRTSQAWQTLPQEVVFHSPPDVFAFLGKTREAAVFQREASLVIGHLPQLRQWLTSHPQLLLDHAGKWESLIRVCEFFLAASEAPTAPKRYLRELRIEGIHTKFIEQHTRVLRLLLDELLPPAALRYEESKFLRRYGLREAEPLVRLRLLDEALVQNLPYQLDDFAVPASKFRELTVPCNTVLIVENLTTFLALPPMPNAIAVWGKGFQVGALAGSVLVASRQLLYWGDLDAAGFQILNQLRAHFPHAQALLMDVATLNRHTQHHTQPTKPVKLQSLAFLASHEQDLFDYLATHNLRLEQEYVPQAELMEALRPFCIS